MRFSSQLVRSLSLLYNQQSATLLRLPRIAFSRPRSEVWRCGDRAAGPTRNLPPSRVGGKLIVLSYSGVYLFVKVYEFVIFRNTRARLLSKESERLSLAGPEVSDHPFLFFRCSQVLGSNPEAPGQRWHVCAHVGRSLMFGGYKLVSSLDLLASLHMGWWAVGCPDDLLFTSGKLFFCFAIFRTTAIF